MLTQLRTVRTATDQASLNTAWFQSIRLHAQFGILLAAGLMLGAA
jgi:hypothetical protein